MSEKIEIFENNSWYYEWIDAKNGRFLVISAIREKTPVKAILSYESIGQIFVMPGVVHLGKVKLDIRTDQRRKQAEKLLNEIVKEQANLIHNFDVDFLLKQG